MNVEKLAQTLILAEGPRQFAYDDATGTTLTAGHALRGNLTIGVGHNLSAEGLSPQAVRYVLNEDISHAMFDLTMHLPWWNTLDEVRARALAELAFNLGVPALISRWPKFLGHLQKQEWPEAVNELRGTPWERQVKTGRAQRIENTFLNGVD